MTEDKEKDGQDGEEDEEEFDHSMQSSLEDDENLLVDDEELGNQENVKLFAEFKVREAGFPELALDIREDPNLTLEQLNMIIEAETITDKILEIIKKKPDEIELQDNLDVLSEFEMDTFTDKSQRKQIERMKENAN